MTVHQTGIISRGRRPDAPLAPGLTASASAHRANPLCGDHITVEVIVEHERVTAVGYRAHGCAFVRASASLLAEQSAGRTIAETLGLGRQLAEALRSQGGLPPGLAELGGVRLLPTRRGCALLPWEAFAASLEGPIA